ncbi:hypothetical protein GOODEAATRI_009545 [Goodea atripinnis]|uniref:Uncharacterized protein n=1 Tax=Goodea atripinnis TaxID=208336 RepID=A0ABV0P332_9TELE
MGSTVVVNGHNPCPLHTPQSLPLSALAQPTYTPEACGCVAMKGPEPGRTFFSASGGGFIWLPAPCLTRSKASMGRKPLRLSGDGEIQMERPLTGSCLCHPLAWVQRSTMPDTMDD